ncbi:Chemotaxis protein methyltransferase [Xanthomonas sacchari]|nr:Chemotaxis protein methyltransferase [Xanthomonas sacchari]MCW0391079.1 Chemotaxis protein methyltransferase [Xanthomonas sacchari]MCW0454642.1 Chemotaxis protein methyltransferase [Xanthomonas sacchari]MCW0459266.1 Chemotaxis protein methyltransferase [Xanthomonas sacchari]MCW0465565.1 Chemotaxis protein methyltransferase [Xanthomonas sacchari]
MTMTSHDTITEQEFGRFQRFIFDAAGITISPAKKAMLCGRLGKRLKAHSLQTYTQYLKLLESREGSGEVQTAIDLLTTNETYFFREPKHFDLLRSIAAAHTGGTPFRCWSAASSSGEEAYSMAMVLDDTLQGRPYEVVGTDISTRVLAKARTGHYPLLRIEHMPPAMLKRYCLKGRGEYEGSMLIDRKIRDHVRFLHANLNATLPNLGQFDVVFLRNVMIYFNGQTKREVVARVLGTLKRGGIFCIGHSESLNDVNGDVVQIAPSVYRKP